MEGIVGRTLQVLVLVFALIVAVLPAGAAPIGEVNGHVAAAALADLDGDRISDGLGRAVAVARPADRFDVVVTWTGPVDLPRAEQATGRLTINRRFSVIDGFHATMTAAQITALAHVPGVFRIEENFTVSATMDEASAEYGTDRAMMDFGVDGSGVKVCVLDTGADPNHEQLDSRLVGFFDSINGQTLAYDDHGHGTHVASMLLGDGVGTSANAARYQGVAPGALLYAGKVLSAQGSGSEAQIIAGIDWCVAQGAHIMSMSLGTSTGSDGQDALSVAVDNAVDLGVVAVVAAGNSGDGPESVGSPGAAANAITVGAAAKVSDGPYLAPFSSRGPTLDGRLKPDIVAPGVAITAADANTGTGYATYSGTSMATPFTAGTVALALDRNGSLTAVQLKANLATTAVDMGSPGADNNWGPGLLDGYSFVDLADGATGGPALGLPAHTSLTASVVDNSLWTHTFSITADDLGSPIAATVLIDGALECSMWFWGICFISEWSPDLDARLIDPNGQTIFLSECALNGDCGTTGQQETIHVMPTIAGDYRLEVYPFGGSPNNGQGGGFWVDLFTGPAGGATPPDPNAAPVAVDDSYSTNEDTPLAVTAPGVLDNDSDTDEDSITATLAAGPANGSLELSADGSFTYTPDTNFNGIDSFRYRAFDGTDYSDLATVSITVNAVNDDPVAVDDSAITPEDTPVEIDVLSNDSDPDGDTLAVEGVGSAASGTVSLSGNTVTYTPNPGFSGSDTFTYTASDGNGGTATATVSVTVEPAEPPPTMRIHVGDLDGEGDPVSKGKWTATVTITVHDQDHSLVAGATVAYSWSDGASGSCTTDGNGRCLATNDVKKRDARITLTVDGITAAGFTYDSAADHDPDGDSDGTSFTVTQG